jgi:plastocyanin
VVSHTTILRHLAVALALTTAAACGGGGGGNPMGPGSGGGTPGPVGATITIGTNNAVSPSSVTINSGESVTFVNNSGRQRQMSSDPHPAHTDCPGISASGVLSTGQSGTTNALTTSRTCGFHDHLDDGNASVRGTIVIR